MINRIKHLIPSHLKNRYLYEWINLINSLSIFKGTILHFFNRPSLPQLYNGHRYLHLGSGNVYHPEFINIDGFPGKNIHYVRPIDNLAPFATSSIDLVYACHCLEHFPYERVPFVLLEWCRVLKQDGTIRISVPDFDIMVQIYLENQKTIAPILGPLLGFQGPKFNYHKSAFNKLYLTNLLLNAGFKDIINWIPGQNSLTSFNDWSGRSINVGTKYYYISLNLEAKKA